MANRPLVSILCFCKDRAATLRRSIDSVIGQSYDHLELVVQDGASTDGTLEILQSYEDRRLRLVSEPDSGPAEAFWKVLNRCQGDIIGTCLSDEELLPGAVERAVEIFRTHPGIGAATCDGYLTDPAGNVTGTFEAGEFNLVEYLFGPYCPFWPGSFFRRQALLDVGLEKPGWSIGALEFEIWCRLGSQHSVRYVPVLMSKYAIDGGQLSNTPKHFNEHMNSRVAIIERMFSKDGFAGRDEAKKIACLYNQRYLFYNHARAYRMYDQMEAMYAEMVPLLKAAGDAEWARAVVKDATPRGLQALTIPKRFYSDFAKLFGRGATEPPMETGRSADPAAGTLSSSPSRRDDGRIRLGYHCSFMDSDTIRFLMSAVIKRHDRKQFIVFGYTSTALAPDIADAFDTVRIVRGQSDERFAGLVRSDEIDIFVEMTGFSPSHRFGAMARRCAPIQISYLNHLGTSAVPNVDFILADDVSVLPDEDRYFTEQVWRLPGSFLCYNYEMVDAPPVVAPPSRASGLVTYGCFGSAGKINDDIIAIWAQILARVSGSRLYIRNNELTPADNRRFMLGRFQRHGIPPERITLDGGTSRDELVRSYDRVDISLDTWPYCGGNTVAESLWQGVPVVTLKGTRFVSRYGASLLIAAGCPELIGETVEEYVAIAVALARSQQRLDHYRDNLRSMAREHGLSDAGAFAGKLDDAYLSMVARQQTQVAG